MSSGDWAADLVHQAVGIMAMLLTPALTYVGVQAARWFSKKTKIAVSEAQENQIVNAIKHAVAFAEEQGYKSAKHKKHTMSGEEKMQLALKEATKWIRKAKLTKTTEEELQNRIEAILHLESATIAPTKTPRSSERP